MEGRNPMEVVGWLGRMGHHTVIDHKAKAASEKSAMCSRRFECKQHRLAAERRSLVERTRKLRQEIEQIFIDTAYWNENVRPEGVEPIDPDPDGQLKRAAQGLDRTLAVEDARNDRSTLPP